MTLPRPTSKSVPPIQRQRTSRELRQAVWLRPRDIFELYGIPTSTLCQLATHPDATRRPHSHLILGRSGRKGIRLFPRADFELWLKRWDANGQFGQA